MKRLVVRLSLLLFGIALFVPSTSALCQDQPSGPMTWTFNDYLQIDMGISGDAWVDEPSPPAMRDRTGRWGVWTKKGDPEIAEDDNIPIIDCSPADGGPGWHWGYTTVRIDGKSEVFGDTSRGGWILPPYYSSPEIGNYVGNPPGTFHSGYYLNSEWMFSESRVFVQFRMVIIRDQVRFEVFLRNDDSQSHNVGLRHCADATTWSIVDGPSYPYIPGYGIVQHEISLTGNEIPPYFEMYNDPKEPLIALRNTLALEDATPPDRIAIGWFLRLQANDWDYTPIPDAPVPDHAWALWWNPVLLNPGESKTIVTYFGMAAATSSWTSNREGSTSVKEPDPYCVAVQGPRALTLNYSASQPYNNRLITNPFKIKAYVYNLYNDTSLRNISAHLTLSPGLELVSSSAVREVASIGPEKECPPMEWDVRADGTRSGELEYWVSVSGTPGPQKTIKRSIIVPATGTTNIERGWQMISVPFKFSDTRIGESLDLTPDTFRALTWDPQSIDYEDVLATKPGSGLWLESSVDKGLGIIATDGMPLAGDETYSIELYTGWNQFGNPFVFATSWGKVKILGDAGVGPVSIDEAVRRNWIRRTIFWWDKGLGEYEWSSDPMIDLEPWRGYWIKALRPCRMIIPPVEQVGGKILGEATRKRSVATADSDSLKNAGDGWRLNLVARAGTAVDSKSVLGVDSRAADGYDEIDIERPPSPGNSVAIAFTHSDWGVNSGRYVSDIRSSATGPQSWDFDVSTDITNADVVLTWPNVTDVPKALDLKLVDVESGVTKYMRTTSSYRFNSGEGGNHRFRLVAEPRTAGKLLITGIMVNTSRAIGGASISYSLSAESTADVVIKGASGKVVRSLAKGKVTTRGINSLSWNYRDEVGDPVPAGSYLIEVVATTPDGEVAKSIRPFLVAR